MALVIGKDVIVMDIVDLDGRTLVGKLYGCKVELKTIEAWV